MRRATLLVALWALACRDDGPSEVEGTGTLEVVEVDVAPLRQRELANIAMRFPHLAARVSGRVD